MSLCTGLGKDGNWIVSRGLASKYDRRKSIDESGCFPSGVTARKHFQYANDLLTPPVDFVELVHEPSNAFDPSAVRVLAEGRRIGYVSASIASWLHPYVALLRKGGVRCYVPLTEPEPIPHFYYEGDDDDDSGDCENENYELSPLSLENEHKIGVMLLPSWQTLDYLCQMDKLFAEFDLAWDCLSTDSLEEIGKNRWKFTESSFREFKEYALEHSIYPFTIEAWKVKDFILHTYLVRYRRVIDRMQRERERAARNIEIVKDISLGKPFSELAEKTGLRESTVRNIAREGVKGG